MGLEKTLEDDPFNELSASLYTEVVNSFIYKIGLKKVELVRKGESTKAIEKNLHDLIDLSGYINLIHNMGMFWKGQATESRRSALNSVDKLRKAKEQIEYLKKENNQLKENIS